MMKKILLAFVLWFSLIAAKATHITNGVMYYEYLGLDANNDHKYKVILVLYRDCAASQVQFDNEITLGVYKNNSLLSATKVTKKTEMSIDAQAIVPALNSPGICLQEARYETELIFDSPNSDYTIIYRRCCRPTVNNIIDETGNAFFVNIIPSQQNNSPVCFNPVALAAPSGMKISIPFLNTDKDSDSLVYRIITSKSGATSTEPIPTPSQALPTLSDVQYRPGFSTSNPFGPVPSYGNIASASGIFTMKAINQGAYQLAYEVEEWRAGTLLTKHIRDVHLIVVQGSPQVENTLGLEAKASPGGKKSIDLRWGHTLQGEIKKFTLQRRKDNTTQWQDIGVTDSLHANYTDSTVAYDTYYWYRIEADTNGGVVYSPEKKAGITKSGGMGVKEQIAQKITLYPNPAYNRLYIESPTEIDQIIITDISGKTVLEIPSPDGEINIEGLPSGVYYLKAEGDKKIFTDKFICH